MLIEVLRWIGDERYLNELVHGFPAILLLAVIAPLQLDFTGNFLIKEKLWL